MMAALFVAFLVIMSTGCSKDGGSGDNNIFVEAPGVPTNFTVVASPAGGDLSATLAWSVPTTGGELTSYEIYRSTTAGTVFDPANHLLSLPATTFEFIDNAGLERSVTTYWIVAAKNAGGETPTLPGEYTPTGGGAGEVDSYGNNFAAAMIFADGYGISRLLLDGSKSWTENNLSLIDTNTSLRPSDTEMLALTEFPYFDENTTFELGGVTYYKQKTVSTWQGEWIDGSNSLFEHNVTAKWGDNLISQTLNTESIVRVEMVLSKALDANMTAYNMVSLYGTQDVEIYGTDKTTKTVDTAFVFATNAHLTIQEVNASGTPIGVLVEDQTLFDAGIPDGPGKFGAEINVAGNLTYGYVWDLKTNPLPEGAGTYRITFTLDDISAPTSTDNNTIIGSVAVPTEGDPSTFPMLDSETSTHIDITIH